MAPKNDNNTFVEADVLDLIPSTDIEVASEMKPLPRVWRNIAWYSVLHMSALYGLYLSLWAHPLTWIWGILTYAIGAVGITAGAHRLWSHRSYKASLPLRILLATMQTMALQNDLIEWCRDHRVHHKFSETNADPHNARRGFFFAHCGWLMCRKHSEVKAKGKMIDISDITNDPVCRVQHRIYYPVAIFLCFILPAVVPWYFWGESLWRAFFTCSVLRYTLTLNATWAVNSVAHLWGNKPYDRHINPVENLFVVFGAVGEGFHNYHHTFPYDYRTSEYGWRFNVTTAFINFMVWIGWATACKKVHPDMVQRRKLRTGDGSDGFGFKNQ